MPELENDSKNIYYCKLAIERKRELAPKKYVDPQIIQKELKCWFHSAKPFFLLFFPPSVQLLALGEIAQIVVIPRSPIVVQVIIPRL